MRKSAALLAITLSIATIPAIAQPAEPNTEPPAYKVEFDIHDGDSATAKDTRRYVMLIEGNEKSVFRVGQKVPYVTGSVQSASGSIGAALIPTQFNFAEVGVNIDCRINEANGKLRMRATVELSTILGQDKITATVQQPIVGQLKTDVNALLTPGKPTLIASMDDPVTSRKFDVEATVTRVN